MSNFRFLAGYLWHKLTAKNRHGLHSPFVYRLVDEVIYDYSDKKVYAQIEDERKRLLDDRSAHLSSLYHHPKLVKLIWRLIADRQPNNIIEIGEGKELNILYKQSLSAETKFYTPADDLQGTTPDMVWISGDDILKHFEGCLTKVNDSTMMVINDIHQDKKTNNAWNTVKANPQVTATVDLYFIGLVFFRQGQVKEDFWIRF